MGGAGTIVLGVTGHRVLPADDDLVGRVDGAIDDLAGDRTVHLLTSLAEGADRLVAHRVLARGGGTIEALLPFPAEDYEGDFADDPSRADFRELLDQAATAEVVTGPTRVEAYEAAGFAVVDRSEALLALWDGRPARGRGGTAEVVARARRLGRPVRVVEVARP
jgi:hypothetical protein